MGRNTLASKHLTARKINVKFNTVLEEKIS